MNRIGLGCMGMARRNEESSIRTVDTALDHGVTMFNVGEFYNGGESEIVLGNALRQHPRDKYFVSVKFGALPSREALYGVDMNPFNVRAHLTYSLSRLGLDYVDLYEPARMDDAYSVEEVIEAVNELVKEGLVRHVGMTECTAEELRRGNEICPIKYFEKEYSLLSRKMEEEDLPTCRELGIPVVAYGLLGHGLLTDGFATGERTPHVLPFLFRPEDMEHNRAIVQQLKEISVGKGCSTSNLAVAWVLQKNPDMLAIVGTTHPDHLTDSLKALDITLTDEEMQTIGEIFAPGRVRGGVLPTMHYNNGRFMGFK